MQSYVGEVAALGAAMVWAGSMSLYTHFGRNVPPRVLNLFKCLLAFSCLFILGSVRGWQWPASGWSYTGLFLSGSVGLALGDSFLFFALQTLGVQKASVIQCSAPALTALFAWTFFGEWLQLWEWVGLCCTTGALAFLMWGHAKDKSQILDSKLWAMGVAAAFAAALCQALGMTVLRFSLQDADVATGTLLRIVAAIVLLSMFVGMRGEWGEFHGLFRSGKRLPLLGFAAFLGTFIGLLLMSLGAKYTKAGVATALNSTTPIWLLPVAHFLLGEKVGARDLVCTVAAVLGVALMLLG